MPFLYVPLTRETKADPGMSWVAVAPVDDISAFAVPTAPFVNPGDSVTITSDHTFVAGKEPIKLPTPLTGSELAHESFGTKVKGSKQTIKYFLVGLTTAQVEFLENLVNEPSVFFIKDGNCGSNTVWQVGCECNPAEITFKFDSGQKGSGEKGWELEIMGSCSLHKYMGALPFRA